MSKDQIPYNHRQQPDFYLSNSIARRHLQLMTSLRLILWSGKLSDWRFDPARKGTMYAFLACRLRLLFIMYTVSRQTVNYMEVLLVILCHVSLHQSVETLSSSPHYYPSLAWTLRHVFGGDWCDKECDSLKIAPLEWHKYPEDTLYELKSEICPKTTMITKNILESLQAHQVWMATLSLAAQGRGRGWRRNWSGG